MRDVLHILMSFSIKEVQKDWNLQLRSDDLSASNISQNIVWRRNIKSLGSVGDHSTGDLSTHNHSTGDLSTDNHSTGDHSIDDLSTSDHSTDDHSTDDHSTDDLSTADHSTDDQFLLLQIAASFHSANGRPCQGLALVPGAHDKSGARLS